MKAPDIPMPDALSRVKALVDPQKNRLHLTIAGKIDTPSLERLYTDIRFCVADLQPGFEVVNDISQCQLIYITSLPTYKKIIDFLIAKKAGEIVRIVERNNISCRQIISFSQQINCYQPMYVNSRQEAEQRLEAIKPRGGIRLKLRHLIMGYDSAVGSGKAGIVDISTSGCAVDNASLALPIGTVFEGSIAFDPHPPLIGHVQMKAKVVRVNVTGFAANFLDLREEFREQLYQRFVYEATRTGFSR